MSAIRVSKDNVFCTTPLVMVVPWSWLALVCLSWSPLPAFGKDGVGLPGPCVTGRPALSQETKKCALITRDVYDGYISTTSSLVDTFSRSGLTHLLSSSQIQRKMTKAMS